MERESKGEWRVDDKQASGKVGTDDSAIRTKCELLNIFVIFQRGFLARSCAFLVCRLEGLDDEAEDLGLGDSSREVLHS